MSVPGEHVNAQITVSPHFDDAVLCTEEAKKFANEFRYVTNKKDGMMCNFKDFQGSGKTAYIYTFHDANDRSTVTVDVRVPKLALPDPMISKKLDAMVNSLNFK